MVSRVTRYTGTAALNVTFDPDVPFQLEEVRVLSPVGGAGTLTVTLDAVGGATYDLVLVTQAMVAAVNLLYQPTRPLQFQRGDALVFAWTNADGRTYGVELIWNQTGM